MRVSIIIPVLNEAEQLAAAIERAWAAGAEEVVVVDGGSDDETVAIARRSHCRFVESERSRAKQQNRGAAVASGDVLLFLHADTWLPELATNQIIEALADSNVAAGAFRQAIDERGVLYRLLEGGNALRVRLRGLAYGDQGIFVRRQLFEQLGGFPEIPLMEDLRLMRTIRKRGRPVLLQGPLHVDARRWQRYGVVRQTLRNWTLLAAEKLGVSPARLAEFYRPHSEPAEAESQHD